MNMCGFILRRYLYENVVRRCETNHRITPHYFSVCKSSTYKGCRDQMFQSKPKLVESGTSKARPAHARLRTGGGKSGCTKSRANMKSPNHAMDLDGDKKPICARSTAVSELSR